MAVACCECGCGQVDEVDEVTQWVLEEACRDAVQWAEAKEDRRRQAEADAHEQLERMRESQMRAQGLI